MPSFLNALSQLCEQTGAFVSSHGSQPADGSLAKKEHAGYAGSLTRSKAWNSSGVKTRVLCRARGFS